VKPLRGLVVALLVLIAGCGEDQPVGVNSSTPPPPITDLRAGVPENTPYESTIRLHWTAPTGPPAAQYEVRAAVASLHADEWLTVDPSVTLRALRPPGAEETVVVGGLQRGRVYYFVVRSASSALVWSDWSNVAALPTLNAPPVAAFTIGPDSTCFTTSITVNAAASTDLEDDAARLEVRWDWENDGIWDTDWSTAKNATHTYADPHVYTVRLEVRDRAGGIGQVTHAVARGPVIIRSAFRLVGHWEEVYYCDPQDPACSPVGSVRTRTSNAYGPVTLSYDWTDQTSLVDTDTLRFDGVIRPGIFWPYHSNWVNYEVTFTTCVPVTYHLTGHTDCEGTSMVLKQGSAVLYVLDPCGDGSQDFTATGQLEVGTYRFGAALDGWQPSPVTIRMRFEMTFDTAAFDSKSEEVTQ
jgi:hypothetical protein